jgi:hypothetical protein
MLVLSITKDLNKLLENSGTTAIATLGKLGRIMVMAIYLSIMFVITVLSAKDCGTYRAREVVDVIFAV